MPPSTPPLKRLPSGVRRALVSLSIALPATALTSCSLGGSHPSPPASQSQAPGAPRFTADSFSVAFPAGWTDKTKDAAAVSSVNAGGTVLMLLYAPSTPAGLNNEHIDVSTVAQPVPDDQLETYLVSAGQNGATNLSRAEPFDLNGSTGIFITYDLKSSNAVVLEAQDMLVNHGGSTYDIVLNTAQTDFAAQLPALRGVLSTWHWKS
jgi:hypothetical protein